MPKNNDPLYAETWHFEICQGGHVIYVGHTTQTLSERLKQHWHTARNNPRDMFHSYLINCKEEDITIETNDYEEPVKHKNKACAEKLENQHILSYFEDGKNTLLNTKIKIKAFKQREPIKITDIDNDKLLTLERYNEIKHSSSKKITPTIFDDTKNHKLKVYYNMNNEKHDTTFRYKKCGIDEAMQKAKHYIKKEQERHDIMFGDINYK